MSWIHMLWLKLCAVFLGRKAVADAVYDPEKEHAQIGEMLVRSCMAFLKVEPQLYEDGAYLKTVLALKVGFWLTLYRESTERSMRRVLPEQQWRYKLQQLTWLLPEEDIRMCSAIYRYQPMFRRNALKQYRYKAAYIAATKLCREAVLASRSF